MPQPSKPITDLSSSNPANRKGGGRFAQTIFGGSDAHSGPNRRERRAIARAGRRNKQPGASRS